MIFFDALLKVFKCNVVCSIDSLAFVNLCFRFMTASFVVDMSSVTLFNCCSTDDDGVPMSYAYN